MTKTSDFAALNHIPDGCPAIFATIRDVPGYDAGTCPFQTGQDDRGSRPV